MSDQAPIDASASLPDGTKFEGVGGLRTLLLNHKEDFVRTLTGKLLSYAIGRGTEYYDLPAIRKISRDAAAADYRWSAIVLGVVNSPPFSMGIVRSGASLSAAVACPVLAEVARSASARMPTNRLLRSTTGKRRIC